MDQNAHGRRPHYHRGRRGQDRRGGERRTAPAAPQDPGAREHREHMDVEQVMREIRARIAKGSGLDLTNQQIQELAARRLEAILDPRSIKPALLEQLRRGAAAAELPGSAQPPSLEVKEESLFDSFWRRLMRPFVATLAPLIQALRTQDTINRAAMEREAAAARRQAEWNALQYELLQKVVTETARVSIEMQSLSLRIESLSTKVDFNERRVRGIEATAAAPRAARHHEPVHQPSSHRDAPPPPPAPPVQAAEAQPAAAGPSGGEPAGDGARKRRRRRRGRRSGTGQGPSAFAAVAGTQVPGADVDSGQDAEDDVDLDEPSDDEPPLQTGATFTSESTAPAPPPAEPPAFVATAPPEAPVAPAAPAPEQPTPPRDEAAPAADAPPLAAPDPGPSDR
jgi:hypothetical protein